MTKGYEFARDRYVMFSAEELKSLENETTHTIDIAQFVPGGVKPYSLFAAALKEAKLCAVGRWTSGGKEHSIVVRSMDNGLAMHQLHFKAEVRTIKEPGIDPAPVAEPELKLAHQLIGQLAVKRFDPNEFADEHRARVEAAIQRKVEGKEVSLAEAPAASTAGNVVDLMAALKASLNSRGSTKTSELETKERKAPKRANAPIPT